MIPHSHLIEHTRYDERLFNGRYKVRVPHWTRIPNGDNYDYEPKRTASMAERLKKGDILYDIGLADGWESAIYAQIVGAENMVLFEPSPIQWPNIKMIWEENKLPQPKATFCGFVSNRTVLNPEAPDHNLEQRDGWPMPAYSKVLLEEMQFRSVLERWNDTPQTTLDSFLERTGIVPRGLSVDVEGAEFLVLHGARQLLLKHHPLLWLSLHTVNGAIFYDYHSSEDEVRQLLMGCGYDAGTYLETHGDAHWIFEEKK
jgi:FkbM family methyltransferase